MQDTSHLNISQDIQPIGGVRASELRCTDAAAGSPRAMRRKIAFETIAPVRHDIVDDDDDDDDDDEDILA